MNFEIYKLEKNDYYCGYLDVLKQLTVVGDVNYVDFCEQFDKITSNVYVIKHDDKVIGTGSIYFEYKFTHDLGCIGHIEDIVIDSKYRKNGLGKMIIDKLVKMGKDNNCYKVILDCKDNNVLFYDKLGFKKNEIQMAIYF